MPCRLVLRTRIISPQELLRDAEAWDQPIRTVLNQSLEEKKALEHIDKKELRRLQEKYGDAFELVPSKLVIAKKPIPPKRVRTVACKLL